MLFRYDIRLATVFLLCHSDAVSWAAPPEKCIVYINNKRRSLRPEGPVLTNDAEDAQDVRSKYHQHVDEGEQNESNGNVTQPVERLVGEQHQLDGSSYLWTDTDKGSNKEIIPQYHLH